MPIALRNACVRASVLLISSEKISEAAIMVNGVSSPRACAMAIAIAVLLVPGGPANSIARPAMRPSAIMRVTMPAACNVQKCHETCKSHAEVARIVSLPFSGPLGASAAERTRRKC